MKVLITGATGFVGRHLTYIFFITLPQFFLYIIGLPLVALLVVMKNKKKLHTHDMMVSIEIFLISHHHLIVLSYLMQVRYGLLYLGYRKNREWWEITIVIRKVSIVTVATFGTMMRVVDLQAFLALFIVFISIIVHLVGQPFDMEDKKSRMLHTLEFMSLSCCWLTFWGT